MCARLYAYVWIWIINLEWKKKATRQKQQEKKDVILLDVGWASLQHTSKSLRKTCTQFSVHLYGIRILGRPLFIQWISIKPHVLSMSLRTGICIRHRLLLAFNTEKYVCVGDQLSDVIWHRNPQHLMSKANCTRFENVFVLVSIASNYHSKYYRR